MSDQPNLGLASTRQLLEELKARAAVSMPEHTSIARAYVRGSTQALLDNLPNEVLDYRTVDHE